MIRSLRNLPERERWAAYDVVAGVNVGQASDDLLRSIANDFRSHPGERDLAAAEIARRARLEEP